MVGRHCRQHYITKAEEEERKQCGICAAHPYHLSEDAVDEYSRVESRERLYCRHHKHSAVDACEPHQPLVDEVRYVHIERQERMAEDIVACRPVAYNRIGYRVEARDMELAYK